MTRTLLKVRSMMSEIDLLAQKMTPDRRNFVAQVEQRIADLGRGPNEINRQTADLRSLAAAENSTAGGFRSWAKYAIALTTLVAVGGGLYSVSHWRNQPAIARVTDVVGPVKIEQNGDSDPAEVDDSLETGQRVVVPR